MINLLNSCFEAYAAGNKICINNLRYINVEMPRLNKQAKMCLFDIAAKTDDGRRIIIEIQVLKFPSFGQRLLWYFSRMYYDLIRKSGKFNKLKAVIIVSLLDFVIDKNSDDFLSRYQVTELQRKTSLLSDLDMFLIELPKWKKQNRLNLKEQNRLDRWLGYLTGQCSAEELGQNDVLFQEVGMKEKLYKCSSKQWHAYWAAETARMDYEDLIKGALNDGRAQGLA